MHDTVNVKVVWVSIHSKDDFKCIKMIIIIWLDDLICLEKKYVYGKKCKYKWSPFNVSKGIKI
jgi:hypothetical protein